MESSWTDSIKNHEVTQKTSSTRGINTSNKERRSTIKTCFRTKKLGNETYIFEISIKF